MVGTQKFYATNIHISKPCWLSLMAYVNCVSAIHRFHCNVLGSVTLHIIHSSNSGSIVLWYYYSGTIILVLLFWYLL